MSLINALKLMDFFILTIVSICAVDGVRRVSVRKEPLRAIAFYLIAVGALGSLFDVTRLFVEMWTPLMFHLGIMIYAIIGLYTRKKLADKEKAPRKITTPNNLHGRV